MEVDVAYLKSTIKHEWRHNNDQQLESKTSSIEDGEPSSMESFLHTRLSNTDQDRSKVETEKVETKKVETKKVENPKSESRFFKSRFSRRARASPIDEGDEDVNDFINNLIKRVDNNLKWL